MRKPEWLFVGGLLLIAAYFIFRHATKEDQFNPMDLVPKNTVAVYETKQPIAVWNNLVTSPQWEALSTLESLSALNARMQYLDTLVGGDGSLANLLSGKSTLFSLHITSKESVGFLFYIPMHRKSKEALQDVLSSMEQTSGFIQSRRTYADMVIQELKNGQNSYEYLIHENYMIIGSTGFLIEDVVRNINVAYQENFISSYREMFNDPSLSSDDGNLYMNGTQWSAFKRALLAGQSRESINLAHSMFFDASLSGKDLLLSGFVYPSDAKTIVSTFENQEPEPIGILRMIPNNTAELLHIGSSNLSLWYKHWGNLFNQSINNYKSDLVDRDEIMTNATTEIGLATLETVDPSISKRLIFLKLSDEAGMRNQLNRIAEANANLRGDSVFVEDFADYQIGIIEINEFPAALFGQHFEGFPASHYLFHQNYLVIASSDITLKEWLSNIDSENTWGQTVNVNAFVDENLGEANLTQIISLKRSWNQLLAEFSSERQVILKQNSQVLKQFDMIGLQISNLENKYYANLNWNFQPLQAPLPQEQNMQDELLVHFNSPISTKPKVVRNHINGSFEILVQDSINNLHLIDVNGNQLWVDSIAGHIVTEIHQIDYLKNKKLQYIFATANEIHLLDRNGEAVAGFPFKFEETIIRDLYVIDYDKKKNYRFIISDDLGNLIMLDKTGKQLDGWNPNSFNSKLTSDIFHLRIRGSDRIIAPQENGLINVLTRRGEASKGFPLDLGFDLESPLFFDPGSTFDKSQFTIVSNDGLITSFNLNGKIGGRNQLAKVTSSTKFALVAEHSGSDFRLIRDDINRLAILDKSGQVIFEKDYISTGPRSVQYYNFGPGKELYIVLDHSNDNMYLYGASGNLLNYPDIQSGFPVSVVFRRSTGKCYIYFAHGFTVQIKSFTL